MEHEASSPRQIIKAASACVWRNDRFLLIQRGKALGHGVWSLPGGKLEAGETAREAAHRELLEETGIVADLTHLVGDFEVITPDAHYMIACWTGHSISGETMAASDAMAARWMTFVDLPGLRLAPNVETAIARARAIIHSL